ncbi:hypothetical protein Q73A0000_05940 [Kaistella flava (ex Peng et al. 2021)]|uniref:Uncharacterized protein n=1 Tax=Kaistella flava (ex Peng et al. 2021) TaxID=2038776 RepID=A0A7M2Y9B3_9FLAO|nr:hypothetical protein [Kaistella flava (ex Peng et al. 2021)]QOW09933.1 hypothetical protein Q73A0000_05940 [Kaistella flava (ex Peng et al. 2021)]
MEKKRTLLKMVFDHARTELPQGSITTLASYLSAHFEERFGYAKNERTFARYYKSLVVNHMDYAIDEITLDHLSVYLGFKNFSEFSRKAIAKETHLKHPLQVTISDGGNEVSTLSETLSNIVINITNSPVFTLPQFIAHHKNSFGIVGFLLLGGFIANQSGYFQQQKAQPLSGTGNPVQTEIPQNPIAIPQTLISAATTAENKPYATVIVPSQERKKECMYWKEDHYEAVFCDEKIAGATIIAWDEGQYKQLKKINLPDTLTVDNALGKVWYDKSNNTLEYFTNYGIHPVNGKTLRPITKHIVENHLE